MTSIDCGRSSCGITHEDAIARCRHCASPAITEDYGKILCLDCGAREDDIGLHPEIDALDSLTEYYAEAPIGEPPAVWTWDPPVRKPVQQPNRKRSAVA